VSLDAIDLDLDRFIDFARISTVFDGPFSLGYWQELNRCADISIPSFLV
jgi:hypothetical protein